MVILELLQFAFLALIIILPFSCIAYIAIKMGWCENKPGNCISAVFSYTACCLTACISLCQRSRRNTEASETVWTPCCSALLTQAHTLACSPPHSHSGAGPGQSYIQYTVFIARYLLPHYSTVIETEYINLINIFHNKMLSIDNTYSHEESNINIINSLILSVKDNGILLITVSCILLLVLIIFCFRHIRHGRLQVLFSRELRCIQDRLQDIHDVSGCEPQQAQRERGCDM